MRRRMSSSMLALVTVVVLVRPATVASTKVGGEPDIITLAVENEVHIGSRPTSESIPVFSPDGRRVVFFVPEMSLKKRAVDLLSFARWTSTPGRFVLDGQTTPRFGRASTPMFSADGERFAFFAAEDVVRSTSVDDPGPETLYLDGEAIDVLDEVLDMAFGGEGGRFAYAGIRDGRLRLVLDGKAIAAPFDRIEYLTFGPQGGVLAFAAERDGVRHVVVGGEAGPGYQDVGAPVFSPDGASVAYRAYDQHGARIVLNGVEQPPASRVSRPAFDPDGALVYWSTVGAEASLWVGGEKVGRSGIRSFANQSWVPSPVAFSADGGTIGYIETRKKGDVVHVGEREFSHPDARSFGLALSPDGRRYAYGLNRQRETFLIADGAMTPLRVPGTTFFLDSGYGERWAPQWSPDGAHVSVLRNVSECRRYWKCDGALAIAIDDGMTGGFDDVLRTWWESATTLRAIVRQDGDYLLVDVRPPSLQSTDVAGDP